MRFSAVDDWSLQHSLLHNRDARAKLIACVLLLIAVSRGSLFPVALLAAAGLAFAQLPVWGVLLRACVVLPFSIGFAFASLLAGRPDTAIALIARSYLSGVCVLLLTGTTPLPALLNGLKRLRAPDMLLEVIQFVYRYLSLSAEQAHRMANAATARGAKRSFAAVAGSAGVLFARSYDRADAIHKAMLARGYSGAMPQPRASSFNSADVLLVCVALATAVAAYL